MKYAGHKSCNLGTFKDINRTKERSKCLLHNQSSLCKFFYLTCIIISIENLRSAFFKQTTLGHDFCFHLNFIVRFFGFSAEGDGEGGTKSKLNDAAYR
jgi:hypothetical protein